MALGGPDWASAIAQGNWIALACVFGLFGVWESLAPWRELQGPTARRWLTNTALLAVGAFLWRAASGAGVVGVAVLASPRPLTAWRFVLSLLLLDLARYAFHRTLHAVPLLWRVHSVHHSDPELDCTSGFRFHPVEALLGHAWVAACVFALGLHPLAVACSELLTMAADIASHANVAVPAWAERCLSAAFVTPAAHRIHHSVDARDHDRNLGAVFVLWDRILRTHASAPAGPLRFGTLETGSERSAGFVRLCLAPIPPAPNSTARAASGPEAR